MNSIRLKPILNAEKISIGDSKLFGNPDVWDGFEWPAIEENGELYDLTFMCQLNCADIAPYDRDGLLPKTGMLYFFYDMDDMPYEPTNKCAAKVVYYNGDISALGEMRVVDENGEDASVSPMKLDFEIVPHGFLDDREPTHLLLGDPSLDYGTQYGVIDGWQMLLQIDSMETNEIFLNFTDEGVLCFYIEPEKLKNQDFSDVRIMQIYS